MRVTKVIKDYIEREVGKKYQEKLDMIPDDYREDYNKMINELEEFCDECNIKAREIAEKYGMLKEKNYKIFDFHTFRLGDDDREQKRNDLIRELRRKRADTVAQIILDLELGETTKKELNSVLENIDL